MFKKRSLTTPVTTPVAAPVASQDPSVIVMPASHVHMGSFQVSAKVPAKVLTTAEVRAAKVLAAAAEADKARAAAAAAAAEAAEEEAAEAAAAEAAAAEADKARAAAEADKARAAAEAAAPLAAAPLAAAPLAAAPLAAAADNSQSVMDEIKGLKVTIEEMKDAVEKLTALLMDCLNNASSSGASKYTGTTPCNACGNSGTRRLRSGLDVCGPCAHAYAVQNTASTKKN